MWETYQTKSAITATEMLGRQFLENALQSEPQSPLAAIIAGLVLLRSGRLDLLGDWLRKLTVSFPESPDGPAVWAEQLRRVHGEDPPPAEAVDALVEVATRGIPYTAEALGYAAELARAFLAAEQLTAHQREHLERVRQRLQRVRPFFRSGGLFSTFMGPEDKVRPGLVLDQM